MSSWEAGVEGPNNLFKGKYGMYDLGLFEISKYHFWMALIFIPSFLSLPILIAKDRKGMFYFVGAVFSMMAAVEDFGYYLTNPYFGIEKLNSASIDNFVFWNMFGVEIPRFYIIMAVVTSIFWYKWFQHEGIRLKK